MGRKGEGTRGVATSSAPSNAMGHVDRVLVLQSNATRTYKQRETTASRPIALSRYPPRPHPALHAPQSSASSLLPRPAVSFHCRTHPPGGG